MPVVPIEQLANATSIPFTHIPKELSPLYYIRNALPCIDLSLNAYSWRLKRMSQIPALVHGSDTRRHKLTGDVHLLLVNGDGQVLFGCRQNTGFEDGAWHLPAGHLEAGESVVSALIREAKEEIGVTIDPEHVEFVHIMHNASSGGRAAFFFSVHQWAGVPENREPEKCSELAWFLLAELPDHLIDYCRVALLHIAA